MKITSRQKWLFYTGLSTVIFGFFLVIAIMLWNVWYGPILIVVFASGILIPFYYRYRYRRSNKEEKQRMVAQKALNRYYYNRWYTPADSTQIEYEAEKIKKKKLFRR